MRDCQSKRSMKWIYQHISKIHGGESTEEQNAASLSLSLHTFKAELVQSSGLNVEASVIHT